MMINPEKPTPLKDELAIKRQERAEQMRSLGVLACNEYGEPAQLIPFPIKPNNPNQAA